MNKLILFVTLVLPFSAFSAKNTTLSQSSFSESLPPYQIRKLYGVSLRWRGPDQKTSDDIAGIVDRLDKSIGQSFDPDCYYRKAKDGNCFLMNPHQDLDELERQCKIYFGETDGWFEIHDKKDGKAKRDFGGIAQGFFLDLVRRQYQGKWAADFAGDIFVEQDSSHPLAQISVAYTDIEDIPFAEVKMKSGWVFGSSSHVYAANMRNPKTGKTSSDEDFQKIVLFGKASMLGARLDAWGTALAVSGQSLLRRLWSMKEFKGQWAYLYFDKMGKPTCSDNIECHFPTHSKREIIVPW